MELLKDPVKVGGLSAAGAVASALFFGLTHVVTIGVAVVGGLLVLRAVKSK